MQEVRIRNYVIDFPEAAKLKEIGLSDLRAVAEVDLGPRAREEHPKNVVLGLKGIEKSAVG